MIILLSCGTFMWSLIFRGDCSANNNFAKLVFLAVKALVKMSMNIMQLKLYTSSKLGHEHLTFFFYIQNDVL